MARGETTQQKVHYKGKDEDFIIFLDDIEAYKKWQNDSSVPMAQFISAFKIYVSHSQGAQGTLDTASNSTLDNEFGTHVDEEVIKKILEKGTVQEVEMAERQGPKNDSKGARVAH